MATLGLKQSEDILPEVEVESILDEMIETLWKPHFVSSGRRASGEWEQNAEARGSSVYGRSYTIQLADGRQAGTMPPVAPLIEWARIKLGLSGQDAINAGWAIAKKMEKEGSKIYREGGTDLIEFLYGDEVTRFINTRVTNFVREQVTLKTQRYINETFK
jgi:hypothetical protein